MNNKTYTILALGILLLGFGAAAGNITNINIIQGFSGMVAGSEIETIFSFDFRDDFDNKPDSSLILKVNIESLNDLFPVWKKDFSMSGFIEQQTLGGLFKTNYGLKCVEDFAEFKTGRGIMFAEEILENGTFYCYDPNNYLDMLEIDSRDEVHLNISSDYRIYPGEYNINIDLMEMERDTEPPQITFILEGGVYGDEDGFDVKFDVIDMYNIDEVKYKISDNLIEQYYNSGWIEAEYNSETELYEDYFNFEDNNLETSGEYYVWAWACDMLDNCREM